MIKDLSNIHLIQWWQLVVYKIRNYFYHIINDLNKFDG